ncbi:MAG: endopeptidase La [Bacteroidota bacterium]
MDKNNSFKLSDIINSDADFIPIISSEDETLMNDAILPELIPILPIRNMVLFPGVVAPITVGRDKSIKLVKAYNKTAEFIGVVTQKDADVEDPCIDDLHKIGTLARILKLFQMPDGTTTVIIQGVKRFEITEIIQTEPFLKAIVKSFLFVDNIETLKESNKFTALIGSIKDISLQVIKLSPNIPSEAAIAIENISSPSFLINFVASNAHIDNKSKQSLLEINSYTQLSTDVLSILSKEIQLLELKNKIQNKVKVDIDKQQREYFLSQQIKTIQEELGGNPIDQLLEDIREKAKSKTWTKEVNDVFEKEVQKLQRMNQQSPDFSIQVNYLEMFVELPWDEFTKDNLDLFHAEKILNKDHYGLQKVKQRILEYLAVLKLKKDMKSPILCLVGPPGVGKTSLGKSIAKALDRKYIRVSLGGLRDESEIRGHRKTYIGAMPGRIIQSIRKSKSANPVFVLDEIDKVLGMNINGDPSAALLEALDPEQNNSFYDNFLEVGFDLSKVLFIATANNLSTVHPALLDRMEIIEISGYTNEEKVEIAKRHLIPKQLEEHGITKSDLMFSAPVIERIIESYTRESGVRTLEKNIAKVIRSRAKFIASDQDYTKKLSLNDIDDILGIPQFHHERQIDNQIPGVVTGLAWTAFGGEILFIESSISRGKGGLSITGNLGDVMKESATIAYQYLKSHASEFGINPFVFDYWNVHIHVPEGATPKDGPSAGITIFTALISLFTQRKVKPGFAMTGEITLRGKVLPVGGVKEKMLAARRAKITTIILSKENERDINEIEEQYRKGILFIFVDKMDEVIQHALCNDKVENSINIEVMENPKINN